MREVQNFIAGFYEATSAGVFYKGSSQELLLFSEIEILNPDEFIDKFKFLNEDDWIGAWFGEEDVDLWLKLFD